MYSAKEWNHSVTLELFNVDVMSRLSTFSVSLREVHCL